VTCAGCRALISGNDNDKNLAWKIEEAFPNCACQAYSVGEGSPGLVEDTEILYRLVVSPVDLDLRTGTILSTVFEKAYQNGLSVFRECATDEHIEALVTDLLTVKQGAQPRTVLALFRIECAAIRTLSEQPTGRLFCVYDETVPRKRDAALPRVPTHASVFQRVPAPGTEYRKSAMQAVNHRLYVLLKDARIAVEDFRTGLLTRLNQRSLAGEFQIVV